MKKILIVFLLVAASASATGGGYWWLNPFFQMLSVRDRPLFEAFLAAGYPLYVCIDWDEHGHVIPGVCLDAPPVFPGE